MLSEPALVFTSFQLRSPSLMTSPIAAGLVLTTTSPPLRSTPVILTTVTPVSSRTLPSLRLPTPSAPPSSVMVVPSEATDFRVLPPLPRTTTVLSPKVMSFEGSSSAALATPPSAIGALPLSEDPLRFTTKIPAPTSSSAKTPMASTRGTLLLRPPAVVGATAGPPGSPGAVGYGTTCGCGTNGGVGCGAACGCGAAGCAAAVWAVPATGPPAGYTHCVPSQTGGAAAPVGLGSVALGVAAGSGIAPAACSGGYHLPSEAYHQPGPWL